MTSNTKLRVQIGCELLTPNEIRAKMNLPPFRDDVFIDRGDCITNCKNCGAPLNAKKYCEYCGTQY